MRTKEKILITGSNGFIGKNLIFYLKKKAKYKNIIFYPKKKTLNLKNLNSLSSYLKKNKITKVIHLAAVNGGVHSNIKYPADFYYQNVVINNNIFEACSKFRIKKLVCISAGAGYPGSAKIPLHENDFWKDTPNYSHLGYGTAKRLLTIQSKIYKNQYNLLSAVLIPPNIYGPFDNIDSFKSSVTASLISKFFSAKKNKIKKVEVWGNPNTEREFLYVQDFVKIILEALEKKNIEGTFNIGTGKSIKISELVKIIIDKVKYKGQFFWNDKKPSGHKIIKFNNSNFKKNFKFKKFTQLDIGINYTLKNFKN